MHNFYILDEQNLMQLLDQPPGDLEPPEPLGPLEQPVASVTYRRNFSTVYLDQVII